MKFSPIIAVLIISVMVVVIIAVVVVSRNNNEGFGNNGFAEVGCGPNVLDHVIPKGDMKSCGQMRQDHKKFESLLSSRGYM